MLCSYVMVLLENKRKGKQCCRCETVIKTDNFYREFNIFEASSPQGGVFFFNGAVIVMETELTLFIHPVPHSLTPHFAKGLDPLGGT